jgi:putative membrane protein
MFRDFLLASAHHLLLFGLVAMLAIQSALLARPIDAAAARRLVGVDRGYGTAAGLLLLAGLARVLWGVKGADFYLHNPWFHAKVGAFVLAALLSILPTLAFIGWRRQATQQPGWTPEPDRVARIRTIVRIELVLVALIFVFAAAMARPGGRGL